MWNKVSKLLGKNNILQASMICYIADQNSEGLFNSISFKNGVLSVRIKGQTAAASFLPNQAQIIEKINRKIGQEAVKRIKLKIDS